MKTKIEISNSFSKLVNCPKEIIEEIWNKLSYEKTGSIHVKIKTKKFWIDNRKHIINKKTNKFPTGILKNIIEILVKNNINPEIIDKRICPEQCLFIPAEFEFNDRYYQKDCLDISDKFPRGTFNLCTGAGKTHLISKLIFKRKLPTLITVPRKGLLKQTLKELVKVYGKKYVGTHKEKNIKPITVMTDASIRSMNQEFFNNFKMLILDEAHHSNSKTYLNANKDKWNHIYYRYFLSGTPFRNDGTDLELKGVIGETLYEYKVTKAIEDGFLVPPYFFIYEVQNNTFDKQYTHTLEFNDEYDKYIVKHEKRNNMIIEITKSLQNSNSQILLLVERKEHGKYLKDYIDCTYTDGDNSKFNDKIIEQFEIGSIKTLIATTGIMGEGIDIKNIDILIICGGYKAESQVIQKIGRILRKKEGKTKAIIIDFFDKNTRHLLKHSKLRMKTYEEYKTKITRL